MVNAFIWMGIALTTFCLFIFVRDDWRMLSRGRRRAPGSVFGHRRAIDDGSEVFAPRVRFQAEDGQQFETTDIVLKVIRDTVEFQRGKSLALVSNSQSRLVPQSGTLFQPLKTRCANFYSHE